MEPAPAGAIRVERAEAIAVVTIDRPDKLNAFTLSMLRELLGQLRALDDDPSVRAIVLTGAGKAAFSTGGDLTDLLPATLEAGDDSILNPDRRGRFFSEVYTPIVAAVEGMCMGGGLELLLGTDIRVSGEGAQYALSEVRWGFIPGGGSHVRLPRQIPWAIAMQLVLTGDSITAQRAFDVGLVNELVADGEALSRATEIAQRIARNSPVAVRTAKEIMIEAASLGDGFEVESALNTRVLQSDDAREGVKAFADRRRPDFPGR
jgi:enoyl-CoA hydratase/carnithine racemase